MVKEIKHSINNS